MEYGIVYLLTNPAMPGLVKIGMTTREDIDARMRELYSTGVPVPFECQFACRVKKVDCAKIEHALHTAFEPQRVNANREFFRINVGQARAILELFHHEDVTSEVEDEIQNDLTADDKAATEKVKVRRPPLNFYEMGLQKGDVLRYAHDESVTCSVESEKKIVFNGEVTSLTAVTTSLKHSKYQIQPTPHWYFKERLLTDIYDETYPLDD